MKKMFSAKKVQMLTLMLLCGTTAVMAQNSAGDYSAGTTALATVTEEIAKYRDQVSYFHPNKPEGKPKGENSTLGKQ